MQTVENILNTVGRDTARELLGVGRSAVSNSVTDNVMPPRWYKVIKALCAEEGIECPDVLFAFIELPSPSSAVDTPSDLITQGNGVSDD